MMDDICRVSGRSHCEVFCDKRDGLTVTAGASAIGAGNFGRYLRLNPTAEE